MSRICSICGKKPTIGSKRKLLIGHYNPMLKRWVYPNLQWTKDPSGKRIKVCTRCLKTLSLKKTK
jgi:ribosomal protein L28